MKGRIGVIGNSSYWSASCKVYIDDEYRGIADFTWEPEIHQYEGFFVRNLPCGKHTVKLVYSDENGGSEAHLDALKVIKSAQGPLP